MTHGTSQARSYGELLAETQPRSITNDHDAEVVQGLIDSLIDKGQLSDPERALLSLLGDLVTAWEGTRYNLPDIHGAEAIQALLEAHGKRQADLVGPVFSTRSVASEVVSGRRALSFETVRRLAEYFHVSPAVFYPRV